MSAEVAQTDATMETETLADQLADEFRTGFEAADRAVSEAGVLDRAARMGERDAYQKAAAVIENYGDLEWAHRVCRKRENHYQHESISAEKSSAAMVRKYNAQFQTFRELAERIENVADIDD